jgi:DNA invertase Pin-like site-specific DNA recombinase
MFIDPLTRNPAILDALPRDQNNDRLGPLGILGCRRHLHVDIGSRHRKELYRKRTTKSSGGILNRHLLTVPDRLGRSVKGLVDLVSQLEAQKIHFQSITDGIDTTTPAGRFFFQVMASLAQMECELLSMRTAAQSAQCEQ